MVWKALNPKVQRISRTYYWIAWLVCGVIGTLLSAFIVLGVYEWGDLTEDTLAVFIALGAVLAVQVVYMLILTKKRFHDVGESTGYFVLCVLLSLVLVGTVLIFLTCIKESDGDNQWGINEQAHQYEAHRAIYAR